MDVELTYFSQNLVKLRKSRGISQIQVAKLAGIPRSTLASLETGNSNATLGNVIKLSKALSVSVDELLSLPTNKIDLIKSKSLRVKRSTKGFTLFNLLPHPVEHIELERLDIAAGGNMGGSPHSKNANEYFICLKGRGAIFVEGEEFTLEKGDTLVFPGDCKHSYHNRGRSSFEGISVIVRP